MTDQFLIALYATGRDLTIGRRSGHCWQDHCQAHGYNDYRRLAPGTDAEALRLALDNRKGALAKAP